MTYDLGAASLSRCQRVDPRLIAVVRRALALSPQDGGFAAEQSRTQAEEDALVAKGVSHTHHSRHIIGCPHAMPGYSGAVDLAPWDGAQFVWRWPLCAVLALAMRRAAIEAGLIVTWGAVWGRPLNVLAVSTSTDLLAASDAYAARQRAAGNLHPLLDGPHYQIETNPQ